MVVVAIAGSHAIFQVEGLDKLWAFRSRLEIPLEHILGADHDPDQVGRWWHGVKVLGTDMPGVLRRLEAVREDRQKAGKERMLTGKCSDVPRSTFVEHCRK